MSDLWHFQISKSDSQPAVILPPVDVQKAQQAVQVQPQVVKPPSGNQYEPIAFEDSKFMYVSIYLFVI